MSKTKGINDGMDEHDITSEKCPEHDISSTSIETADKYGHTQRGLKSRHIQLIAIGGAIGTGLFVGSGSTLSTVGPAPLFMAFVAMSAILWVVMQALTEMTTYLPIQGAAPSYYIHQFFEPSLAFAAGWNYVSFSFR